MTFDVLSTISTHTQYNWQRWYEAFSVCRNCHRSTIFVLSQRNPQDEDDLRQHSPTDLKTSLNPHFEVEGFIALKDIAAVPTPDHVDPPVSTAFHEGAVSVAVGNWNAAGTMFRLAIDLATKPLLPAEEVSSL